MSLSETLGKIRDIVATLGEDDPELNDIIQTETNIDGLLDKLLFKYNCEDDFQDAANVHIENLMARHLASRNRQDGLKDVLQIIMESMPDKTKRLPAGTVTLRAVAPKVVITDESKLPDDCFEVVRKLSKAKVNELYQSKGSLDGCYETNGGQSITIRRK